MPNCSILFAVCKISGYLLLLQTKKSANAFAPAPFFVWVLFFILPRLGDKSRDSG